MLIALALVPVLLLFGWSGYQRYETRRAQALETELEVAQTFEAYVDDVRRQSVTVGQGIASLAAPAVPKATRLLRMAAVFTLAFLLADLPGRTIAGPLGRLEQDA